MSKRVPFWSLSTSRSANGVRARRLDRHDRLAILASLKRRLRENLYLYDLTANLGLPGPPGEARPELFGAWRDGQPVGVASLYPSVSLECEMEEEALESLFPYFRGLPGGLVKSPAEVVDRLWARMQAGGAHAFIDRSESACAVTPGALRAAAEEPGVRPREARESDLPDLVEAARASLQEEGRPDPHDDDPAGFRRWVAGRILRARVVEVDGRIAFVGYTDILRPEGCLLQGVYTWPEFRRRGVATVGISGLCASAFAAGADHVQLAVIDGNLPAERLYSTLGFRPFAKLRTILFR